MAVDNTTRASRRSVLRAGATLLGVAAAARTTEATAQEKLAQNVVQYQEQPKDGQECDGCVNWEPPNGCKIVAGNINPKGWCVAYAPKQS